MLLIQPEFEPAVVFSMKYWAWLLLPFAFNTTAIAVSDTAVSEVIAGMLASVYFASLGEFPVTSPLPLRAWALKLYFMAGVNAMDVDPYSGTVFASVVYGVGGDKTNFLATLDPETGQVTLIGQAISGLDALAFFDLAQFCRAALAPKKPTKKLSEAPS